VNLDAHVFSCFDKKCRPTGDVIDLWAAIKGLLLRAAALDLVHTFVLEPPRRAGTEKRSGSERLPVFAPKICPARDGRRCAP
jgi:hypothetical protein